MSALDDIAAAAAAMNALTAAEQAEKARIDAAVAAALSATVAPYKVLYVDAVAGLDTNDGSSPAKAVATLQQASALVGAGQRGVVYLCSDVTLTSFLSIVSDLIVYSQGNGETGTGSPVRTIKVTPAAMAAALAAGATSVVNTAIASYCYVMGVNIAVGAITAGTSTFGINGNFVFGRAALTFDPGMTVPCFGTSTSLRALINFVASAALPASYAGRLFAGVAAGANPNGATYQSNLTSA